MADTTFAPGTVIKADWLQDVNDAVYNGTLPEGGGDLTGPASSTTGHIAMFSDSTGKVLADTGISIPSGYIVPGDELVTADAHQTLTWKILGAQCGYQGSRIHQDYGGVPDPTTASEGQVLTRVSGQPAWSTPAGAGLGDVVGPTSSTTNRVAAFDGTTGKLLKDSGILSTALATLTGTETLTNKTIGSGSSYAGTRISVAYGGVPDPTSATDGEVLMRVSGTPEWASVSGSGLGDVVGPASATNNAVVTFDGTTGKLVRDSTKLLPAGTLIGTSDVQTLTSKTMSTGCVWNGTDIAIADGGTGASTAQTAINNLTTVAGATVGQVLTKVGTNAVWATGAATGTLSNLAVTVPSTADYLFENWSNNTTYSSAPYTYWNDTGYTPFIKTTRNKSNWDTSSTTPTYISLPELSTAVFIQESVVGRMYGYESGETQDRTKLNNRSGQSNVFVKTIFQGEGDHHGIQFEGSVGNPHYATHNYDWDFNPTLNNLGGAIFAWTPNVNITGHEFQLTDNGYANVNILGMVINLSRENSSTPTNKSGKFGAFITSQTANYCDSAVKLHAYWNVGFDAVNLIGNNRAALAMKSGDRIYWNVAQPTFPEMKLTLSGAYTQYDSTTSSLVTSVGLVGTGFLGVYSPTTASGASAGAASALPSNPFTYMIIKLDGVSYKIPVYNI